MLASNPGSMIVTAVDLLALSTCIGVLGFRIWVVRFKDELPPPSTAAAVMPLWWLVGICLVVLTLSSVGELIRRTMEMSGRPLAEVGLVLPQVLSQTHFGRVWLLRPVALLVLWSSWCTRPRLGSPAITAVMLAAACLIAASRSLSGHAADWGDITLPELMDWSHLLAASLWGGSLIGLTLTGFRSLTEAADARRQFVAAIRRWSALAGVALAVVALTGIYNAWLELQHFEALWQTDYGRILLLKLSLVLIIVALGASNRYLGIPSLRAWADGSSGSSKPSGLLATTLYFLTLERRRAGKHGPLERFVRRAKVEGALMIGALLCVTILLGQMPARHQSRMPASHHTHANGMAR